MKDLLVVTTSGPNRNRSTDRQKINKKVVSKLLVDDVRSVTSKEPFVLFRGTGIPKMENSILGL